jgi:hypothetical protein
MTIYELQSIVNFVLPTLAALGYLLRFTIGLKSKNYNKYRVMLPLFFLVSFGMGLIYLLNITNWWRFLEPDYETYSRLFVRPYFTFLGSVLFLSSWVHPELHPIVEKIRSLPWTLWHSLTFRKK